MTTNKQDWKPVAIGGVTGIVLGAGSMYAAQSMNADAASDEQQEPAATLQPQDEQSFREAFQTARAEMGPGGVFRWHGNLYNTYTAEEWQAMSDHDKNQFAENVAPQVSHEEPDVTVAVASEPREPNLQTASVQTVESDDVDVRIVGFGDVDLPNGNTITVEELDVNGQRVAVIDVDQDGVADVAMSDVNNNRQVDEGEVIDLHTGEPLSFTNEEQPVDTSVDMDLFNA